MTRDFTARLTPSFVEGAILAVNGIADAALAIEGPGCARGKMLRIGQTHDYYSTLFQADARHRVATTSCGAETMLGDESRLRELALAMLNELAPGALFLLPFATQQAMGRDVRRLAGALRRELDAPVASVPSNALDGDWLDGYSAVLESLVELLPAGSRLKPGTVGLVGHFQSRSEGDERGNAAELSRLLETLDLDVVAAWTDGSPVAEMARICECETLVALPYATRVADRLARRTGARVVRTPLPVGIDGTCRFLRAVGESTGRADRAGQVAENEAQQAARALRNPVALVSDRISVALLADRFLGPAIACALHELGVEVPLVGILAAQGETDQELPARTEVLVDPSGTRWEEAVVQHQPDLIVGSGSSDVAAHKAGVPLVEVGYPAYRTHFFTPTPYCGTVGIRTLFGRLVTAWAKDDTGRRMDGEAARNRS